MKRCSKCKELKDESEFRKNRSRKDEFCVWCKKCLRNYARKRYLENSKPLRSNVRYEESHRTIGGMKQKRCTKCKKWKDEIEFAQHRYSSKDGLDSACKECKRVYAQEHYNKGGKGLKKKYYIYEECHRVVEGVKQKLCTKCKRWKAESDFYKERRCKDGLRYVCKECMLAYAREHYNKEEKGLKKNIIYKKCHRVVEGVKQKRCCRCKRWKAESDFYKNRLCKDGLQYLCKICVIRAANKSYKKRRRAVFVKRKSLEN